MELGTFQGWSTTWILRALRDNGLGHLHSFDWSTPSCAPCPPSSPATGGRSTGATWPGNSPRCRADTGYLFVDADHGRRFARGTSRTCSRGGRGTPVSVHDVFHARGRARGRRARGCCAGSPSATRAWFTAARRHAPADVRRPRRGACRARPHRRPWDDGEPDDLLRPAIRRAGAPHHGPGHGHGSRRIVAYCNAHQISTRSSVSSRSAPVIAAKRSSRYRNVFTWIARALAVAATDRP